VCSDIGFKALDGLSARIHGVRDNHAAYRHQHRDVSGQRSGGNHRRNDDPRPSGNCVEREQQGTLYVLGSA